MRATRCAWVWAQEILSQGLYYGNAGTRKLQTQLRTSLPLATFRTQCHTSSLAAKSWYILLFQWPLVPEIFFRSHDWKTLGEVGVIEGEGEGGARGDGSACMHAWLQLTGLRAQAVVLRLSHCPRCGSCGCLPGTLQALGDAKHMHLHSVPSVFLIVCCPIQHLLCTYLLPQVYTPGTPWGPRNAASFTPRDIELYKHAFSRPGV